MKSVYKYQTMDHNGRYIWMEKSFKSQFDLLKYLVGEKELVISQKKSIIKRADSVVFAPVSIQQADFENFNKTFSNKGIKPVYENDKEAGLLKRTLLTNTYWWMDSHDDVHLGRGEEGDTAVFTESIKGRESKVYPIDQHNFSLDGRMGKTLKLYEAPISWRALGVGKTGMTEGLFADAEISKAKNAARYEDYLSDEIDQHSVGMRYIDVELAVNDEENFPKETKVFKKYINKIGNRQAVELQGYFFAVGKASLMEYSAVIAGSNELTPTMNQEAGATGSKKAGAVYNKTLEAIKQLNKTLKN